MHAFLRRISIYPFLLSLLMACPGWVAAGAPPAEIRLGKASTLEPKADPAQVRAIERFYAARQSASIDRSRLPVARRMITGGATMDAATLVGGPGQILTAFDFTDGAIERTGTGRFRVSVYVLFADHQGKVVQSRNEVLAFAGEKGAWTCSSLQTASVMEWASEPVAKTAARLHMSQALDHANEILQEWATKQTQLAAYSIEDVYPTAVNRVMIPCLAFSAVAGKRGYDVVDTPIMMRRGSRGFEVESPAN
jgi:hypothetical protein